MVISLFLPSHDNPVLPYEPKVDPTKKTHPMSIQNHIKSEPRKRFRVDIELIEFFQDGRWMIYIYIFTSHQNPGFSSFFRHLFGESKNPWLFSGLDRWTGTAAAPSGRVLPLQRCQDSRQPSFYVRSLVERNSPSGTEGYQVSEIPKRMGMGSTNVMEFIADL